MIRVQSNKKREGIYPSQSYSIIQPITSSTAV
nr:MAG TPA: hypothetical protein [Caudoviricetes sp.]